MSNLLQIYITKQSNNLYTVTKTLPQILSNDFTSVICPENADPIGFFDISSEFVNSVFGYELSIDYLAPKKMTLFGDIVPETHVVLTQPNNSDLCTIHSINDSNIKIIDVCLWFVTDLFGINQFPNTIHFSGELTE